MCFRVIAIMFRLSIPVNFPFFSTTSLIKVNNTAKMKVRQVLGRSLGYLINSTRHASSSAVEVRKEGQIFLIGLNRPEKRNAVDPPTAKLLHRAFKDFESDESSLVAVFHGKGGHFCGGYDLRALSKATDKEVLGLDPLETDLAPMGPTRLALNKPVIGAISGYAVAGGTELSLLCDLRVVEETAKMGIFCRRFGIPLTDGGTVRLQKLIGLSRALDLILTGREIDAREAYMFGIANRVVEEGRALEEAIELAKLIAKYPQKCMNTDRLSAYYSAYNATDMKDALKFEFDNGKKIMEEEAIPGAKDFASGIGKHGSFEPWKPKV